MCHQQGVCGKQLATQCSNMAGTELVPCTVRGWRPAALLWTRSPARLLLLPRSLARAAELRYFPRFGSPLPPNIFCGTWKGFSPYVWVVCAHFEPSGQPEVPSPLFAEAPPSL